ncbi:hypothetical protein C2E23DRAFT_712739, partial [Lenzites betulinus]
NPTTTPLPSLLGTLIKKGSGPGGICTLPILHPGSLPNPSLGLSTDQSNKATKMQVTKNKMARDLYAHVYLKSHPTISATDFDKVWKALGKDTLKVHYIPKYDALRKYVLLCSAESFDEITNAWSNFGKDDCENYYKVEAIPKDHKEKGR